MARMLKIIGLGLVGTLVLLALLITGVLLFLDTPQGQRLLQTRLNAAIPGTVSWERLDLSLLAGRLEMAGVLVQTADHKPVARLEQARIEVEWSGLFSGNLTLPLVRLAKPQLQLEPTATGQLNLAAVFSAPQEIPPPPSQGPYWPLSLNLPRIVIETGLVEYTQKNDWFKLAIGKLELDAAAQFIDQQGHAQLTIQDAHLAMPAFQTPIQHLLLAANLAENRLAPLRCELRLDKSQLTLSGHVQDPLGAPRAELDLDVAADLDEVRQALKLGFPVSGRLQGLLSLRGPLNQPEAVLRADYGGGLLDRWRLGPVHLSAQLKDQVLHFEQLKADLDQGRIEASGAVNLQGMFPNGLLAAAGSADAIHYDIALAYQDLPLQALLPAESAAQGQISGSARLSGRGVLPAALAARLELQAQSRQLAVGQTVPPTSLELSAEADLDPNQINLKNFKAKAGDLALAVSGHLVWETQAIQADLRLSAPDLAKPLAALGLTGARGALDLKAAVSGVVLQPVAHATVAGRQLGYQDLKLGDVDLEARLSEDGLLAVPRLIIRNRDSRLEGAGALRLFGGAGRSPQSEPLELTVQLHNVDSRDFIRQESFSGIINGELRAEGQLNNLKADGRLKARDLTVAATRLGEVETRLKLAGGLLNLERLTLRNGASDLEAAGRVQLFKPASLQLEQNPSLQLRITSKQLHLQDFTDRLKGQLTLAADLSGRLLQPAGSLTLQGAALEIAKQPIAALQAAARLEGDRLHLEPLTVDVAPGDTIRAIGWIARDQRYELRLEAGGVDLKRFQPVAELGLLEGLLTVDLKGRGSLQKPHLTGDIIVRNVKVNRAPLEDVHLRLDVDEKQARVAGNLNFDLEAALDWQHHDLKAALFFKETELAPYTRLAGQPDLNGRLSGKVNLKGKLAALDRLQAEVNLTGLDLNYGQLPLVSSRSVQATLLDGLLRLPATELTLAQQGRLTLQGEGRLEGPLAFKADGTIPMATVKLFTDELPDITGALKLAAQLGGSAAQPEIKAEIRLEQIAFTIPELLQKVTSLSGRIHVTPQTVRVEAISGSLDKGRFSLSGSARLTQLQPDRLDFSFKTQNLLLTMPDMLDVIVDSDLSLSGPWQAPALKGQIVLVQGLYYKDVRLQLMETFSRLRRPAARSSPAPSPAHPLLARVALDVTVTAKEPFVVDNNMALLTAVPDLRIHNTLGRPLIRGRAEVKSGTVRYQKRDFDIRRGVVDFINPYKIEPLIDIQGDTRVREWTILLSITGTPDNLDFNLSSRPPASDEDIFSLLATGQTAGESGVSMGMLANLVAQSFEGNLEGATGLDSLEMGYEEAATDEDEDQVEVTVGKELSRRMAVKYDVQAKQTETVHRVTTDYKLLERIILSAFQDTAGDFGGELQFRIEFR